MRPRKQKKDFGQNYLKDKKRAICVAFFCLQFFWKKETIIEIRRKKEKIKSEVLILKINEKNQLKKIAKDIAKISQSSDFFLNRNDLVTSTDKEHIKMKNLQLYSIAYSLLEMSGATKEDLEGFLDDYVDGGSL
ncbi:TPA: hypothetical protein VV717_002109 [Streptococcus pneumoniae]|nr:hypothetical protein [Streptococcus pneumoniae]